MSWWRFWANTFMLYRNQYQPHARAICWMIVPVHEDWAWQYYRDRAPANDNGHH